MFSITHDKSRLIQSTDKCSSGIDLFEAKNLIRLRVVQVVNTKSALLNERMISLTDSRNLLAVKRSAWLRSETGLNPVEEMEGKVGRAEARELNDFKTMRQR